MPFRITPPDLRSNCVGPWLRVDLYQGTWNPQTQTFARDNGDPALFGYVCQPAAPRLNPAVLKYLNRLSDLLFVMARTANDEGRADVLWIPGKDR